MTDERHNALVLWFEQLGVGDAELVGGKGASLGELYRQLVPKGVRVPNGFATTALAYRRFLDEPVVPTAWHAVEIPEGAAHLRAPVARTGSLGAALDVAYCDAHFRARVG